MERNKRIASHEGVVEKVQKGMVKVRIVSTSACAACAAHAKCGFADSKEKVLDVPSADWEQYAAGQAVQVDIDESRGMQAVWIAYVLPAVLGIGVVIGLSAAHVAEGLVALAGLGTLGIYVLLLFLVRRRIESRFTLKVRPC